MRSHPFLTGAVFRGASLLCLGLLAQLTSVAAASPACSGDACEAVSISADGCTWKNSSTRPISFKVVSSTETLVSTVLGPGESFRQTDQSACVGSQPSSPQLQASFAAVRKMPDAPDFTLKVPQPAATASVAVPRPKPVPADVAPPSVTMQKPVPRSKPQLPAAAEAPAPVPQPAPVAVLQPTLKMPTQAEIDAGASPCGDACGEILFKALDNCLWVQSQNPKPIIFQATIGGRMTVLALEGASYEKSASTPATDSAAYHARQRDPFQSSSPGIPVYRARLGDKGACVTDKTQISQFVAVYRK